MKNVLFIAFIMLTSIVSAQKDKTYNSLKEAFKNPTEVYRLDLNWQKLGTITDSIKMLKNLTYLRLSSNELTDLPKTICELQNLTELDLSFNKLETLPNCIDNLVNLKKLDLSSNNLVTLPETIVNLKTLTLLNISFNKFQSLPEEIGYMNNLSNIEDIRNQYDEIQEKAERIKMQEEQEKALKEKTSHFKYELTFKPEELLDKETGEFNAEKAYRNLPWKVEDIYEYLNTKTDFIYDVEMYSLEHEKVTKKGILGYKMEKKENSIIESLMYNYDAKEYLRMGGMFADLKTIIRLDSISPEMKFMPVILLASFRTLDKQETIKIGKKEYICTVIEGTFMFEKARYWMVTDQPGLIPKMVLESTYKRKTWLLKKVK